MLQHVPPSIPSYKSHFASSTEATETDGIRRNAGISELKRRKAMELWRRPRTLSELPPSSTSGMQTNAIRHYPTQGGINQPTPIWEERALRRPSTLDFGPWAVDSSFYPPLSDGKRRNRNLPWILVIAPKPFGVGPWSFDIGYFRTELLRLQL